MILEMVRLEAFLRCVKVLKHHDAVEAAVSHFRSVVTVIFKIYSLLSHDC